jgi:RNA polymerase-binding transcription factor DksA
MSAKKFSAEKLEKYERILLEEQFQTQKIITGIDELQKRGIKDRSGDLSSYSVHQADLGTDTDESEKRVYFLNQEIEKLKHINFALKRIFDQSYGICEICGKAIPETRLRIVPYAKLCIDCKCKEEQKKRRRW